VVVTTNAGSAAEPREIPDAEPAPYRSNATAVPIDPLKPATSTVSVKRTSAAEVANRIDELVFRQLETLQLKLAPLSSDHMFVRRVNLEVIGTLPTADEAADFLDDLDPGKRAVLNDGLMDRPEFGDYWRMEWSDGRVERGNRLLRPATRSWIT
jgi:Protein of unknown function (DUF1549)